MTNTTPGEMLDQLIERRKQLGSVGAIDFLIDMLAKEQGPGGPVPTTYTPFACKTVAVDQDLDKYRRPPKHLPAGFKLPPLVGLANDYSHLVEQRDPNPAKNGVRVSIVILTYNRCEPLERTLAGVASQSYPLDLIEVIVADDGSSTDTLSVVRKFDSQLDIRYVWQRDTGFSAASSRNNGVNVARNDFVILLDVDMFPSRDLVANYVKWWPISEKVTLIGPRKYIDMDGMESKDILSGKISEADFEEIITNNDVAGKVEGEKSVDWRLDIFGRTDYLKTEKNPYRVFASGNVAFSKRVFNKIGGFDERFKSWGYEDTELGYRFYRNGCYMVPEMGAWAYHQEPAGGKNEVDRSEGKKASGELFGDLCPHYRKLTSKTENFEAPTVSIYIPAYNAEKTICDAVESALNQTFRDLEVCICDDGSTDRTAEILERYYGSNPRVRFVSQKNGGIGSASNIAVGMTKGLFIGQLDSDDYLAYDVVEKCVAEFLKDKKIGLVYTTYENEHADGRIEQGYNYPVFTREKMITAMIAHHFRMFRRIYWGRTEGFNERIRNAVDYDMYLKLAETCEAKHLNVVGYRRRLHGENTSIKDFKAQMQNTAVVVNAALSRMGSEFSTKLDSDSNSALSFDSKTY